MVVWRYVLAALAYLIFVAAYLGTVSIGAVLVVVPPADASSSSATPTATGVPAAPVVDTVRA